MHCRTLLLVALCLAGCLAAYAAAPSTCKVVPPGKTAPTNGVAGWKPKDVSFTHAYALAFVGGELYEADEHFTKQNCPPHNGLTPDERMAIKILGVCTKVRMEEQSSLYRVSALIKYPCKGRAATTLNTSTGKYACPKDRFCVKTYLTANAPFSFDFSALFGVATEGEGEGEGYGEVLNSVLDLHLKVKRYT